MTILHGTKMAAAVVWLALLAVQVGFGAYGVVISKFAKNNKTDPLVFSLMRDAFAFPVLLLAAFVSEKRIQLPAVRELPMFLVLGLFGMFGNQLLYILGIYYTSANIASVFQPAIPVWTSVLAMVTRLEPLPPIKKPQGWAKCIGILAAVAGATIMVLAKHGGSGTKETFSKKSASEQVLGYIFLLGNTLSMAVYILLQKQFVFNKPDSESPWKQKPVTLTAWTYMFGAMLMGVACLYYVNQPDKFAFPMEEIYPVLYAIFISSSLCYLLITWCNMQISASLVTATWPLQVLFCAILAYIILGEEMTTLEYVGGSLIILALVAVVWSQYAEEKEQEGEGCVGEHYGYVRVSKNSESEGFIPESRHIRYGSIDHDQPRVN